MQILLARPHRASFANSSSNIAYCVFFLHPSDPVHLYRPKPAAAMVQAAQTNTAFRSQRVYDECPLALVNDPKDPNFQIRIIELAPGKYHEPIVCEFLVTPLKGELRHRYRALSYASEETTVYQPIRLNNKLFGIPQNLVLALKRLRREKIPVPL